MAYEKHTWAVGEEITSAKLNHMEDGIAEGGSSTLVVTRSGSLATSATFDKTWQEIYDAYPNVVVSVSGYDSKESILAIYEEDGTYFVIYSNRTFTTSERTGYPSYIVDTQ